MIKNMLIFTLLFGLCSSTVLAQVQEKKSGMSEWLKELQKKISQIAPKKTVPVTTSVAGVRGSNENAQVKLYWKGKNSEETVTDQEMTEFKNGIDLAAGGDVEASAKKLEAFMNQYPDSALIPDAKKTLDLVKAEPKPQEEKKQEETQEEVKEEKK